MKTTKIANKQIESFSFYNTIQLLKRSGITLILLSFFTYAQAQEKILTLNEAIQLGLENSKQLKLSQARVNEAVSQYNQIKDKALPTASTSFAYNQIGRASCRERV